MVATCFGNLRPSHTSIHDFGSFSVIGFSSMASILEQLVCHQGLGPGVSSQIVTVTLGLAAASWCLSVDHHGMLSGACSWADLELLWHMHLLVQVPVFVISDLYQHMHVL
jgi:hypothetical protein